MWEICNILLYLNYKITKYGFSQFFGGDGLAIYIQV